MKVLMEFFCPPLILVVWCMVVIKLDLDCFKGVFFLILELR